MWNFKASDRNEARGELKAKFDALNRVLAIIEFDLDGRVITANDNFLKAIGYSLNEIQGKKHQMFVDPSYGESAEYRQFWDRLKRGEFVADTFKRIGKGGKEIWIEASYNPVFDADGTLRKVIKFATDVTEAEVRNNEAKAKLAAIDRALAVIEFTMDGTVITANDIFLKAFGYGLSEIVGKHHRTFVDPAFANGDEYRRFWARLARGEFVSDKFRRIAKGGREVWIEATYNPILDANGKPTKVVKFATDITEAENLSIDAKERSKAVDASMLVVEYAPDGTITRCNDQFCEVLGYSREDLIGRNHSIFVSPEVAASDEYRKRWQRLASGEHITEKGHRKAAGGRDMWVVVNYSGLRDADGKVFKIVNYLTDVTASELEHRAAEAERATRAAEQKHVVDKLADGLERMASGDLTTQITDLFPGEYEQLRKDFNRTMDRLRETMESVLSASGSIGASAGEISNASDDLSRRTEQQAASLEETAAALEEITATVKKTAQNAQHASSIVATAKVAAENGGQVVETAITAMGQIEQSSKQITDIIGVMDEIAFQTNLLALNAGVEAARAGDAGKGFAVVASEVRSLAQRSSEAAREIKALIKASGEHVGSGVRLVGESGGALKKIVEQVIEINTLVAEMSLAAQQQSTGIEEVNTAVTQMDQVTQQNAAMVEQATAAARALAGETDELNRLIGFFHVGKTMANKAPPAARPASSAPVKSSVRQPAKSVMPTSRPSESKPQAAKPAAATSVPVKPQPPKPAQPAVKKVVGGVPMRADVGGDWQEF